MTDLRKAIEEIIRHTRANVQFSTNTPAAETNIQVETDAILAILSQERAALLDAIESKLPEENTQEEWQTIPSGQTIQDKDLHNYKAGYNQALDQVTKLLADMRGEL